MGLFLSAEQIQGSCTEQQKRRSISMYMIEKHKKNELLRFKHQRLA
jgi:hypothetical protein